MSAYEDAAEFYRQRGECLDRDMDKYCREGYVCVGPTYVILAVHVAAVDCWHIHFACGRRSIARFFELAPHPAKFVSFARPGKGRSDTVMFNYERMRKLCRSSLSIIGA